MTTNGDDETTRRVTGAPRRDLPCYSKRTQLRFQQNILLPPSLHDEPNSTVPRRRNLLPRSGLLHGFRGIVVRTDGSNIGEQFDVASRSATDELARRPEHAADQCARSQP